MQHEIETRNDELDNFEKSGRKSLAMEPREHITSVSAFGNVESPEIGATYCQTGGGDTPKEGLVPARAGQKARPDAGLLADSRLALVPPAVRFYTFRARVYGIYDDATYMQDLDRRVFLAVPWSGERIGDELTVTVEVRP